MNVYDSQQIENGLKPLGYQKTSVLNTADLIIVNTCSVREKAQEKAFSFLGRLADLKRKNSNLIVGIGGCVAQQEGKKIIKRVPFIDIVFGTRTIGKLPQMVRHVEKTKERIVNIEMTDQIEEYGFEKEPLQKISSFVTIMRGCDNYCTYCVVPHVRGRETSRNPQNIIDEIQGLVQSGIKEVSLLGQNVNSFGKKENLCSFPELLSQVNEIQDLLRIRFTTSHPKDFSDELIVTFKDLEKLCKHIHLPVQSGANTILKRMNRKYTKEMYLEKIEKLRNICPDIAVTSDMIVGFPSESRADFNETLDLMRTVEFDGLFAFMYSDRPNTRASGFSDKISASEKNDRLLELLDLQEQFTKKKNQALVGRIEPVLVEGISKKQGKAPTQTNSQEIQWTGRTSTNKIVNFLSRDSDSKDCTFDSNSCINKVNIGKLVNIRIEKAFSHSLSGSPAQVEPKPIGFKGETIHAA